MDSITQAAPWFVVPGIAAGLAWMTYRFLKRRQIRTEANLITRALSVSHAIFTSLGHVPDNMINRDLRRALVMLISHHLKALRQRNPDHAHLNNLQTRVSLLNRIPSGFQTDKLRDKVSRRQASMAFESLSKILKEGQKRNEISQRDGALAYASAIFASQQIAVDTARQAAKDAEHIRAYSRALDFTHQALSLCRKLPPLIRGSLSDVIQADLERLQELCGHPSRI